MEDGITVIGSGEASAPPDVVRLSIALQADGADVSQALTEVARRVTAVADAARSRGVAGKDIQTSGAGVQPRYRADGLTVLGYQAYHALELVVRDVMGVGALVSAISDAAYNTLTVNGISLGVADQEPLARKARDAAFASARDKAQQYAALAGRTLAQVVSLSETTERGPSPVAFGAEARLAAVDSMPVQPGETTVRAAVAVRWALGPPLS
ncbi:MAG TPA: SIMPL domain-containing protein [Dermatophilaceae bacterium]|nr:SIMPL domain-containing protein [Dermatophilaceae bacterium]